MLSPLADKLRPDCIEDIVGQEHILGKNKMLRNIVESNQIPNMIFYGPPGTGKTTLAQIISNKTNLTLKKLNATTASIQDIKDILSSIDTFMAPNGILLYLDEIQYFNKKQQQSLLEFLENGKITLIASTTENPYFYIYNALLSRAVVFEFKKVSVSEIIKVLKRSIDKLNEENTYETIVKDEALKDLAQLSGGDVRRALNLLELCFLSSVKKENKKIIDKELTSQISDFGAIDYEREGDQHYDLLSAFQKSMRGSDPDAAIYYLARLLSAGDLISACRRLMVCAAEDVGLAYPQILPIVKSCVDIAQNVGLPEARIPLADAVVLVSISPKSNSSYKGINSAMEDIKNGEVYAVPRHLKNIHCDSSDVKSSDIVGYKYPHDYKDHWINQQYLPDEIKDKIYYEFGDNKVENSFKKFSRKIGQK